MATLKDQIIVNSMSIEELESRIVAIESEIVVINTKLNNTIDASDLYYSKDYIDNFCGKP
jgi:uncharacterized small protein (DUF1192 family)